MFTLNAMLTTLSSGDFLKSQKVHPTIELAHQNWVLSLKLSIGSTNFAHILRPHIEPSNVYVDINIH